MDKTIKKDKAKFPRYATFSGPITAVTHTHPLYVGYGTAITPPVPPVTTAPVTVFTTPTITPITTISVYAISLNGQVKTIHRNYTDSLYSLAQSGLMDTWIGGDYIFLVIDHGNTGSQGLYEIDPDTYEVIPTTL